MFNQEDYLIKTVTYNKFGNKVVTVITTRNLGEELRVEKERRDAGIKNENKKIFWADNHFTISRITNTSRGAKIITEGFTKNGFQVDLNSITNLS